MQPMKMGQQKNSGASERHLTHRRLERWIRLQQFVYGLPDDYSYAVFLSQGNGSSKGCALVSVGWMSWFGQGKGADPQHALAVALLESSEALSANARASFFHRMRRRFLQLLRSFKRSDRKKEQKREDLLAS